MHSLVCLSGHVVAKLNKGAGVESHQCICCMVSASLDLQFYSCKVCSHQFCSIYIQSLNGKSVCCRVNTSPWVLRVPPQQALLDSLRIDCDNIMYSLLCDLFQSGASVDMNQANMQCILEILLKLAGLSESISRPESTLFKSISRNAELSMRGSSANDNVSLGLSILATCSSIFRRISSKFSIESEAIKYFESSLTQAVSGDDQQITLSSEAVTVSTGSGEDIVLNESSSYWESNCSGNHWIEFKVPSEYVVTQFMILVQDHESYSPKDIRILYNGNVVKSMNLPYNPGWTVLATKDELSADSSTSENLLRMEIKSNHRGGCDSRVTALKVLGSIPVYSSIQSDVDGGFGVYATPSLPMALKLCDFLGELLYGNILVNSRDGVDALIGLLKVVRVLHVSPNDLMKYLILSIIHSNVFGFL